MSRQNHNANYIFDVDGETVWEKLRMIRTMLEDKRMGYDLAKLDIEHKEEILEKDSYEHKKYLIHKPQMERLLKECEEEIKFLEEFESWLKEEAEKTRIPGKTDEEMYEINYFDELKFRLVRRAQAQFISHGSIEPDTLGRIMKNRKALELCVETGMLNDNILNFTATKSLPSYENNIKYLENSNGS